MRSYLAGQVMVRRANLQDAGFIAANLREIERRELWAAYRKKPWPVCQHAVEKSEKAFCIQAFGQPVAIFGVRTISYLENKGLMWLLATDQLKKISVAMQKYTKSYVDEMLTSWNELENYVHSENKISLRWLKAGGFSISEPFSYGFDQERFVKITKKRAGAPAPDDWQLQAGQEPGRLPPAGSRQREFSAGHPRGYPWL